MAVSEAAAERLHTLYADELRWSLRPPVHPMVNARQTRAMIRHAREGGPGLCEESDATTWIWSDLHLGHEESLTAYDRPFRTPDDMDRAMRHAWYELVDVDDTIICLGDVGVDSSIRLEHQVWWREAPGAKWLVLGNHDVDRVNKVLPVSVDRTAITLFAPGEPPLLLTHLPLLQVPAGCINVHGHVHGKGVAEQQPAHQRERRAVELPAGEAVRHQAAGPSAAGRKNRPRAPYQGAAEHRGNHHAMMKAEATDSEPDTDRGGHPGRVAPRTWGCSTAGVKEVSALRKDSGFRTELQLGSQGTLRGDARGRG